FGNLQVVRIPPRANVTNVIALYQNSGLVAYAEPDYFGRADTTTPHDTSYSLRWGLNQASDADIDAPEAWDFRTAEPSVVVAVIDSGVRYTHQDLALNMWRNLGEIPGNGIDDDGNGYVDDVYGIN